MKKLVIMQGLPGSGKGYVIKRDYPDLSAVCSADNFFRAENPNYDKGGEGFNPSKLGEAHKLCFSDAHHFMSEGHSVVIVDNTNLDNESIAPYVALAGLFDYEVEICRVSCDPSVAAARNTHGVPEAAYDRMSVAFDRWTLWAPHKFAGVKVREVNNGV